MVVTRKLAMGVVFLLSGCALNQGFQSVNLIKNVEVVDAATLTTSSNQGVGQSPKKVSLHLAETLHCKAVALTRFNLVLDESGVWNAKAKVVNLDTRSDAIWDSTIIVKLGDSQVQQHFTVTIHSNGIDGGSSKELAESGFLDGIDTLFSGLTAEGSEELTHTVLEHSCVRHG